MFGNYGPVMVSLVSWTSLTLREPYSDTYRVLGWVPGIITMVLSGIIFWITSITMHKYIMKNPQIKDICESSAPSADPVLY